MKGVLIYFMIFIFASTGVAQNTSSSPIIRRSVEISMIAPIRETVFREALVLGMNLPMRSVTSCGLGIQIRSRMYTWSVNITAGTYYRVQTIDDNIPSIGGAGPDGTAYYIDGIRVRTD